MLKLNLINITSGYIWKVYDELRTFVQVTLMCRIWFSLRNSVVWSCLDSATFSLILQQLLILFANQGAQAVLDVWKTLGSSHFNFKQNWTHQSASELVSD